MSVSLALSRLLHVSALVSAAVLSFFTCSASPVLTQVDNGVKHSVLRSLYSPYNQNPPLYLPAETNSETRTSGTLRKASSIIDQQLNHQQFSYDQNSPHNKRPGTAVSEVRRGHRSGMRLASSRSDRPQPRGIYQPENTNTYYNEQQIIRKSFQTEAGSPFYLFSQFWPPENAPKPHNEAKYPGVFSFKMAGDENAWTYSDFSLHSHPNRGYWSTAPQTPRGRCSDGQEANGVQRTSVSRAPSLSQSWDAFIKSDPSLEKRTPSITDFTQGRNSVSSSETQTHRKAHSHLLKDSQTSLHKGETAEKVSSEGAPHEQRTSAARGYGRVSSNPIRFQQSHRKAPSEEAQHRRGTLRRPCYDTAGPHYSAHTHTPTTHPPVTTVPSTAPAPTQLPSLPASDKALESLAPVHHAGSHDSNGPGSEQPVVGRPVNKAGGSAHDRKHTQSTKRLYGFRGFKSPTRRAGTEPPVLFKGYRFNKENLNTFKTTNTFLSPKSLNYSFQGASATTQANAEMTPARSSPASSGFKKEWTESDTHVDKGQNHRQVRVSKKIYGLKGFSSRPHEGADALVREPNTPATLQQDLEGFELRSSQLWQSRGSTTHSRGQAGQGAGRTSTRSQTKSEDFNLQAAGSVESVKSSRFSPNKYEKHRKSYAFLVPDSPAPRDSSADLTAAGGPTVEHSLTSEPEGEAVAVQALFLNSPTSSVAKATRVTGKRKDKLYKSISSSNATAHVAIVRLPKWPISVTYADVVGSASFSRVRAAEDDFTNSAATSRQRNDRRQRRENTSGRPQANAGDNADEFSSVEEKKQSVKHEGGDSGMETLDALLKSERGGNRPVNHVQLIYFTKSQTLGEKPSGLDHLQKSPGNVSVAF